MIERSGEEYKGRVAFITGGGRGIGKALGQALVARGARVVIAEVDMAAGDATASEFRAAGGEALSLACDVSDERQVEQAMARTAQAYGGIDILINNAALHSSEYNQSLEALGIKKIRQLFDVNVLGVIICSLAARPHMAGRENASIINISSTTSYDISSTYGVTKLAVRGLTMNFARQFQADGIRSNGIAPGLIFTDTIRREVPQAALDRAMAQQISMRQGTEEDIAEMMLFLTSSRAGFINGETFRVSGGLNAQP